MTITQYLVRLELLERGFLTATVLLCLCGVVFGFSGFGEATMASVAAVFAVSATTFWLRHCRLDAASAAFLAVARCMEKPNEESFVKAAGIVGERDFREVV